MTLVLDAAWIQLLVAGVFAFASGLLWLRQRRGRGPPSGRVPTPLLAGIALLCVLSYFGLGRHPQQWVKTWDVRHSFFGAKYAEELGYFRIYECLLLADAQGAGVWRDVEPVTDLRAPRRRANRAELLGDSDCAERFTPQRWRDFASDVAFFQALPRQPEAQAWFSDNGYNQTPFYTALTAPLLGRAPPGYGRLLGLSALDPLLELLGFGLLLWAFGARLGLLAAIFFFTSFWNQFALMGGSVLRFGYLALLLATASLFRRGRFAASGAALGVATLFQVFPAFFAAGFAVWAGQATWRERRLPEWAAPAGLGFAASLAAGLLLSLAAVGLDGWREFADKMALHNLQLSQYRVGLKLLFVLGGSLLPDAAAAYAGKVEALARLQPLYLLAAAAALLGTLALARRLEALEFALFFGCVALYLATPVHYYFAVLLLLFLLGAEGESTPLLTRALLFALSAGAFALFEARGSLGLVNGYFLSVGLGVVLSGLGVAWWMERARSASAARRAA